MEGAKETSWLLFPLLFVSLLSQNESMAQPGTPNFKGNSIHSPFLFQEFMHSGQFSSIGTMWFGKGVGSYCNMLKSLAILYQIYKDAFFFVAVIREQMMVCSRSASSCIGAAHDLSKYCCWEMLFQIYSSKRLCVGVGGVVLGVHSSQIISLELTYT